MEPLGQVEFAVLEAVNRGAFRSRCTAGRVCVLQERAARESTLHDVLRRCERDGLVRSNRDRTGRRYELTPAGRVKLRADRRFRATMIALLARSR